MQTERIAVAAASVCKFCRKEFLMLCKVNQHYNAVHFRQKSHTTLLNKQGLQKCRLYPDEHAAFKDNRGHKKHLINEQQHSLEAKLEAGYEM